MDTLTRFVCACKTSQDGRKLFFKQEFQEIILDSCDKEMLLQAFLFFNIDRFFPEYTNILMYEQTPDLSDATQSGKCDFVYISKARRVMIIETKFIDYNHFGPTARKRRNNHRQKVVNQSVDFRAKLSRQWSIPIEIIDCSIFTTEDLNYREKNNNIISKYISIEDLNTWHQEEKKRIQIAQLINRELMINLFTCEHCPTADVCYESNICFLDMGDGD
ncbi:hypothetical protein [Chamaesiphon sp.]|uniref:hypothetical protein n=1 Tax=Chamaesiphon sp. TaxID=2814140 RepID=UPI003593FE8E